ncbi:hypothetical protein J0X14_17635 [Muricauda sp. CAU 1633]|uniref:hypothetical protein n=1 Tax=Allomuricauda sp. CAU 1633 TaxID=2816036 RepID=UPI001A9094AB|nr:hypothetical protein [Muricauda sp. CAU 1633]MBO0324136.1 hypothetical protein [Muricauda sp. CAU 1633]
MKPLHKIFLFSLLFIGAFQGYAQPFTLDKAIQPVELKLLADTRAGHEGELGIVYFNRLKDSAMYHYVTGHDLYNFVDVLVTSVDGTPLKVSLAKDNWEAVQAEKNTANAQDGMIDFKIRTWGSFGIKIETEQPNNSLYNITVLASPEKKTYLGSAFRTINEDEMTSSGATSPNQADEGGGGGSANYLLYIALGVALLVIGVLAGKLMGRKGKGTAVILILFSLLPFGGFAQDAGDFLSVEQFEAFKKNAMEDLNTRLDLLESERKLVDKAVGNLDKTISTIRKQWDNVKLLYSTYNNGLGKCISSAPPAQAPSIPSICTDLYFEENGEISEEEDQGCASCFLEARKKFNNMRYQFEKLATIYKCTKDFSNAAISFGDDVSGFTPSGVGGLAWQTQRRNIEKSVTDLEQAYDNKYGEFLQSLADAMMELNICEAKYGVEDWYDRFGYMYFEFMKDKYQRKD